MDITKTKKVMMRTAKIYLLITLILAVGCASSLSLQQVFEGTYYLKLIPGEVSVRYQFNDGTFNKKSSGNLDMENNFGGTYHIAGDTLILDYEPFDKIESSTYSILSRTPFAPPSGSTNDSLGSVSFRIIDRKGNPIRSADVVVRNRKEKMIRGYGADSLGKGPQQFITDRVHDFSIGYVGHHPVIIPADTLSGYHTEVEVMLTGITYSQFDGTKKLLIKEIKKNRIVLQRIENDQRVVLVRGGPE